MALGNLAWFPVAAGQPELASGGDKGPKEERNTQALFETTT